MILCIHVCLKQSKMNARTALQMFYKIIEMIHMYQKNPTYPVGGSISTVTGTLV